MSDKMNRRTVLRAAGGLAVTFPFLATLAPRKARAAASKRILFWWQPDGVGHGSKDYFFPMGTESSFTLNRITAKLETVKSHLVFTKGINNTSSPSTGNDAHASHMRSMLTSGEGTSIDQLIADKIAGGTPYKTLEIGVGCDSGAKQGQIVYRAGKALAPQNSPSTLFMRVLGGAPTDAAGQSVFDRLQRQRKSVLDGVSTELTHLKGSAGRDDKAVLESHSTSLRELEKRLETLTKPNTTCAGAKVDLSPLAGQTQFWGSWEYGPGAATPNFEKIGPIMHEIASLAFRCDVTRVATMTYSRSNSGQRFPWLPLKNKDVANHVLAHQWESLSGGAEDFTTIMQWRCDMFRNLIERFKATPDSDGNTLFDNTVIVWISDYGNGDGHSSKNVPFTIATGKNTGIKTNRYVQYNNEPHARLLLSLAQIMGAPVEKLGAGSSPLSNIAG